MNYLYCECFAPIFFAEYIKGKGEDITIITINKNLIKYCDFAQIRCIYIERVGLRTLSFHKLFIFKKNIWKVIDNLNINKEDKFYLFDDGYILEGFYFARLLRNKHVTYYYKTNEYPERYKNKISLRLLSAIFDKVFYELFLGLDLILIKTSGKHISFGIDKDIFFKKNNISIALEKKSFNEIRFEIINDKTINIDKYESMFVDQGNCSNFLKNGYLDDIIKAFSDSSNKIVIKEHPHFSNTNLFEGFDKFPVFVPAEFLLGNIKKNVISICSTTLITVSKIDQLNAISLLELVEWKDEAYKKEQKEYLKKESNNKIIFVETMEELINFL